MGDGGLIFFVVFVFLLFAFLAWLFNNPKKGDMKDEGETKRVYEPRNPEEELVMISQYMHLADAQTAQMKLQSEEIESFLENEYSVLMTPLYSPAMGGVKLLVKRSDAERAQQILNESPVLQTEEKTEIDVSGKHGIICPKCGSDNTYPYKGLSWLTFIPAILLLGNVVPVPVSEKLMYCFSCKNKWKIKKQNDKLDLNQLNNRSEGGKYE